MFSSCKGPVCESWLIKACKTFPLLQWRESILFIAHNSVEVIIKWWPLCQALKQTGLSFLWNQRFPYYWQPGLYWLVAESRIHYVNQKEWRSYVTLIPLYENVRIRKLRKGKHEKRCSFLERKGGPTKSVDSWFHFVWIKESRRISHISLSGEKGGMTTIACRHWL